MASLHDVERAILQMVQSVTNGIFVAGNPVTVKSAIGWPPENALQEVARKGGHLSLISVYDRRISRNVTRWAPYTLQEVINPTGMASVISNAVLQPARTVTVTLSGTINANDAVSIVLNNTGVTPAATGAQVAIAGADDTPTTVAAALVAKINSDAVLSTWITASATGAAIALTNILTSGYINVSSNTGNTANWTTEVARRLRQFQISVWSRTEEEREAVTNPIESQIALVESQFGLALPDNTMARVVYVNDHDIEDATLEDVLRRDFFVSADYAITSQDVLFSVLAPVPQFAVQ